VALSDIIRRATEIGQLNSTITFEQLNEATGAETLETVDIENLFSALNDKGINLVEAPPETHQ
jgi:hypothetical protein